MSTKAERRQRKQLSREDRQQRRLWDRHSVRYGNQRMLIVFGSREVYEGFKSIDPELLEKRIEAAKVMFGGK